MPDGRNVIATRQLTEQLFGSPSSPVPGLGSFTTDIRETAGYGAVLVLAAATQPFQIVVFEACSLLASFGATQTLASVLDPISGLNIVCTRVRPCGSFMKLEFDNLGGSPTLPTLCGTGLPESSSNPGTPGPPGPPGPPGSGILQSGSIQSGMLGACSVLSGNICSGQVGWPHLASGAVRSGDIGDAAVVSGAIGSGQVGQFQVSSGAITSGRLGVTGAPIGTNFLRDDFTWAAAGGGTGVAADGVAKVDGDFDIPFVTTLVPGTLVAFTVTNPGGTKVTHISVGANVLKTAGVGFAPNLVVGVRIDGVTDFTLGNDHMSWGAAGTGASALDLSGFLVQNLATGAHTVQVWVRNDAVPADGSWALEANAGTPCSVGVVYPP